MRRARRRRKCPRRRRRVSECVRQAVRQHIARMVSWTARIHARIMRACRGWHISRNGGPLGVGPAAFGPSARCVRSVRCGGDGISQEPLARIVRPLVASCEVGGGARYLFCSALTRHVASSRVRVCGCPPGLYNSMPVLR